MIAARRRATILRRLDEDGMVRVSDLVEELGVSDMTIRRDLGTLHAQGMLEKVHGGAVTRTEHASTTEPGFAVKSQQRLAHKHAIAERAAQLVQPGMSVAVSAGTTTYALSRHLARIPRLTVVTNSVWVADALHREQVQSQTVLLTGGLRTPSDALVGPMAVAAFASLHLDLVFMGVHGMDVEAGFSTPNLLEAETNRAMIASGRRLVVVADSMKWGVIGLSSMAPLASASTVVTDAGLSDDARAELADQVRELVLVEPHEQGVGGVR